MHITCLLTHSHPIEKIRAGVFFLPNNVSHVNESLVVHNFTAERTDIQGCGGVDKIYAIVSYSLTCADISNPITDQ